MERYPHLWLLLIVAAEIFAAVIRLVGPREIVLISRHVSTRNIRFEVKSLTLKGRQLLDSPVVYPIHEPGSQSPCSLLGNVRSESQIGNVTCGNLTLMAGESF